MHGIMEGVRVLEVAQWWYVPAAAAVLSDWGADVVKVEHPRNGDPMRGLATGGGLLGGGARNFMFQQPNRGKRSVGIDIATDDGREVLLELAARSDVFVTSFLPAARRRLQIDVDDIRAVNPGIIYARGHGQGARGPDAERGGYDAASFWARGGIAHALTPQDAGVPVGQRAAFGDSISAMTLAGGVAGALFRRERTGDGAVVDVSLLGAATWAIAPDAIAARMLTMPEMPVASREDAGNPAVNSYRTADGRWLHLVMLESDRYWPSLCDHLGRPDLVEDPRFADAAVRMENRRECVALLDEIFASATLDEWRQRLATVEGVWAPMQSALELHADPQVIANGYVSYLETEEGELPLVASPVEFDETPRRLVHAPEPGQHTEEVLLELGADWDRIIALKESGAIT